MRISTSILIVLVIVTTIVQIIAGWMKLTHKLYADDALTFSMAFYVTTGLSAIIWLLVNYRNKKIRL